MDKRPSCRSWTCISSNDTRRDIERKGMITQEILNRYGCNQLVLTKTTKTAVDEDGNELDVWYFSFESSDSKNKE